MSASQSPASLRSNLQPTKQTTQRRLVIDRDEFQALLAAAYLVQENRDRLADNEPGKNYIPILDHSFERAPSIRLASPGPEAKRLFTQDAGLNQLQSKAAESAFLERERNSQETFFRMATLGAALLVAIVDLGVSFHRFSPLGRLAPNAGFYQVPGKQANVVTATKILSKVEDRIRADRRLQGIPVHVSDSGGIITLSGYVNSEAQRVAAVEDARMKGVKVVVDNLRVINPEDQSAAAMQESVDSIALQFKAPSEAFHLREPAQPAHTPAVTNTISIPASTNPASHATLHPLSQLSPNVLSQTRPLLPEGRAP